MSVFPLFMDLRGKKCVVVGGGNVATRKIEALLDFDADIHVISPESTAEINELYYEGRIKVFEKKYEEKDLENAFLVIAATSDSSVNEIVYVDAVGRNVPVNVVDCPQKCTFIFPSIVKRGDLVIGISTSGGYPALSKCIREKVEMVIPETYAELLMTLKECRRRASTEVRNPQKRREMLGKLMEEVLCFGDNTSQEDLKQRIENIFGDYRDEKNN